MVLSCASLRLLEQSLKSRRLRRRGKGGQGRCARGPQGGRPHWVVLEEKKKSRSNLETPRRRVQVLPLTAAPPGDGGRKGRLRFRWEGKNCQRGKKSRLTGVVIVVVTVEGRE